MSGVSVPEPNEPSKKASELSRMEMASLGAAKRNTVLYERYLEDEKSHNAFLVDQIHKTDLSHNKYCTVLSSLENLKQANVEMFVAFGLATVAMAIGSTLISSFPRVGQDMPWEFICGWVLVVCGIVFGLLTRFIVMAICKFRATQNKSA